MNEERKLRKSLFGGYPHEGIKSQEVFKPESRLYPRLVEGKIGIMVDHGIYPNLSMDATDTEYKDFLLDRIADYDQALDIAEKQIRDTAIEYPFIPQDFLFEESAVKPDLNPDEYVPTYFQKGPYMIARIQDEMWLLVCGGQKITISLPNAHIAYLVLRSLGVITDEEFMGDTEFSVNEKDLTNAEKVEITKLENKNG